MHQNSSATTRDPEEGQEGKSGERLFFELALEDLTRAADLFRPILGPDARACGRLGCRLEVSPLLAHDTASHARRRQALHTRVGRPNLLIQDPGTRKVCQPSRSDPFAGVPINCDASVLDERVPAAADAFLRGH